MKTRLVLRHVTYFAATILGIAALGACADSPTEPVHKIGVLPPQSIRPAATALTSTLNPGIVYAPQYLSGLFRVNAINNAGLVVGDNGGNNVATAWSASTGYITVGGVNGSPGCCSALTDVNSSGIASGWSTTTGPRSMTWNSSNGTRTDLNIDPHRSVASGINALGSAVGYYYDVSPNRAFYKPASGAYMNLPLGAGATGATAFDINASEAIVGDAYYSGLWRAALWATPGSPPQNLGTLGGPGSRAWQINDDGDVVGWSLTSSGVKHAFLWTQSTGMVDLSTWPNSCAGDSEAFAINNLGVIAGRCNYMPVLWTATEGMRYLPLHSLSSGGEATDINDNNQVVGHTFGIGVTLWEITNQPPAADAGGAYAGTEGSAVSFDASASSDPDGDALDYSWTFGDPNVAGGGTATGISPSHVYADNGTYTATLTVTDPIGASHSVTTTVDVSNAAPVVGTLAAPVAPVPVGTAISVSASFSDVGPVDTHSAVVDWDANGTTTGASVAGSGGVGSLSASHIYSSAGVYTVKATVTDNDGASDEELYQYIVVYDPAAGFVTGGGWINSPTGALTADPVLTGKANFGFVSRYEKGKIVPAGNTEFQFHAASLNFNSTSYEWLVVAGAKAQYKGTGKINGLGSYKFILTATDGQISGGGGSDRFRIKIWDAVSGDVIYDNQNGDLDDATASNAIAGGNIVIHQK